MRFPALFLSLACAAGLLASAPVSAGKRPARPRPSLVTFPKDAASWPATRYATLSAEEARDELTRREIPFEIVTAGAPGVLAPVRLTGAMNGVSWHSEIPVSERARSPWDVFDARLVLALDDFGALLREHGIDEVIIFSAWRPPPKSWPEGKLGDRHPGGVAVDAKRFHKKDGDVWLDVEDDFHGRVGATTCGERASPPAPRTAAAAELRELVCRPADGRLFHSILTPNYNRPHRNHFHLEVKPGVGWQLVR